MFLCWVVLALFFSGLAVEIALVVEMLNAFDALIGLDTQSFAVVQRTVITEAVESHVRDSLIDSFPSPFCRRISFLPPTFPAFLRLSDRRTQGHKRGQTLLIINCHSEFFKKNFHNTKLSLAFSLALIVYILVLSLVSTRPIMLSITLQVVCTETSSNDQLSQQVRVPPSPANQLLPFFLFIFQLRLKRPQKKKNPRCKSLTFQLPFVAHFLLGNCYIRSLLYRFQNESCIGLLSTVYPSKINRNLPQLTSKSICISINNGAKRKGKSVC